MKWKTYRREFFTVRVGKENVFSDLGSHSFLEYLPQPGMCLVVREFSQFFLTQNVDKLCARSKQILQNVTGNDDNESSLMVSSSSHSNYVLAFRSVQFYIIDQHDSDQNIYIIKNKVEKALSITGTSQSQYYTIKMNLSIVKYNQTKV